MDKISTCQYSILLVGRLAQQATYCRSWISGNNNDNSINSNGSAAICVVSVVAMHSVISSQTNNNNIDVSEDKVGVFTFTCKH